MITCETKGQVSNLDGKTLSEKWDTTAKEAIEMCYTLGLDSNLKTYRNRSIHTQKSLLDVTENELLMYGNSSNSDFYENMDIVSSFVSMVERIVPNSKNSQPIKMIINEDIDTFYENIRHSNFDINIKEMYEKYNQDIISVLFIDPKKEIKVNNIEYNTEQGIHISKRRKNTPYQEINSFSIADNKYIQMYIPFHPNSHKKSITNFGKPEHEIQQFKSLFHEIVGSTEKGFIDLKEIL